MWVKGNGGHMVVQAGTSEKKVRLALKIGECCTCVCQLMGCKFVNPEFGKMDHAYSTVFLLCQY